MDNIYDIQCKAVLYFAWRAPRYLPEDWQPWFNEPLTVLSVRRVMFNRKKKEALNLKLMNPRGQVLTIENADVDWCLKWFVTPDERIPTPWGLIERGELVESETYPRI